MSRTEAATEARGPASGIEIAIRRLTPEEARSPSSSEAVRFVLSAWIAQANRDRLAGAGWTRDLPDAEYWSGQHDLITQLCRRGRVDIATVPEEPDLYLGWLVSEPTVLHYVYVKTAYRGVGVCSRLMKNAGPLGWYTHQPRDWFRAHLRAKGGLRYSPYRLMEGKGQ